MMPTLKLVYEPDTETDTIPMPRPGGDAPHAARFGRLVGTDPIDHVERSIDRVERHLRRLDELAREPFRFDNEDDGPRAA